MDNDAVRLAEFLGRQPDQQFCVACLASVLTSGNKELRVALGRLAVEAIIHRIADRCGVCRQWGVVYGRRSDIEVRSPEDRLRDFLEEKMGQAFCNMCLSRTLRMPFHTTRKAADRLRMARVARLDGGRCRLCDRLRLVIGLLGGDQGGAVRPHIA